MRCQTRIDALFEALWDRDAEDYRAHARQAAANRYPEFRGNGLDPDAAAEKAARWSSSRFGVPVTAADVDRKPTEDYIAKHTKPGS